jgi:hypothetical protein
MRPVYIVAWRNSTGLVAIGGVFVSEDEAWDFARQVGHNAHVYVRPLT